MCGRPARVAGSLPVRSRNPSVVFARKVHHPLCQVQLLKVPAVFPLRSAGGPEHHRPLIGEQGELGVGHAVTAVVPDGSTVVLGLDHPAVPVVGAAFLLRYMSGEQLPFGFLGQDVVSFERQAPAEHVRRVESTPPLPRRFR